MPETITICDDLIDKVIPSDIGRAITGLCQTAGFSVCGGGQRPRLVFQTPEQRTEFVTAAKQLGGDTKLGAWLASTNPRLAVHKRGRAHATVPSVDFL